MYHDIGLTESINVLHEIIVTAAILAEVMAEEKQNEDKEGQRMDTP